MGLCGCYPACACQMRAGNDLVSVTGTGDANDPFVVSGVETPFSIQPLNTAIAYEQAGPYGHAPKLGVRVENSPTIALSMGPGGLSAHLLQAPGAGGGVPSGTPLPTFANVAPDGYLMMTGPNRAGYVPINSYPTLFGVLGHMLGPDRGDGTFYVGLPDDHFLVTQGTRGPIGTKGGEAEVPLGEQHLPPHTHPATDIDGLDSPAGEHSHTPATAGRSFVTVDTASLTQVRVKEDGTGNVDLVVSANDTTAEPGVNWTQRNNGATSTTPNHQHDDADGGVTVGPTGGGQSHNNMPPFVVVNYMVKT